MSSTFFGYRNADNGVGVRNHVLILSLASFCQAATQIIAQSVPGTRPLLHPHGRNEIGIYQTRLRSSLLGAVTNGNVHSVLVVGYEPETTDQFVGQAQELTKKPIESVVVLGQGTLAAAQEGSRKALRLMGMMSDQPREVLPISELIVAVKCGGSDATSGLASNPATGRVADRLVAGGGTVIFSETTEILGAEHILIRRAANARVATDLEAAVQRNEQEARDAGIDLIGINPVPDNIAGGISTIEEKSLGAILKAGTSPIQGVVEYGVSPSGSGLYFMDSPSAATEVMTGLSAAGAHLILFTTGSGNPVGNPISPVVKITANPNTLDAMGDHIDVDISAMLSAGVDADVAAEMVFNSLVATAEGHQTRAELTGHMEFAPVPVGL